MKYQDCSYIYIDWKFNIIEASLSYKQWKEDDCFIAECPELKLMDYGDTVRESVNNLSDMIIALLTYSLEHSKIEAMLKKLGFKLGDTRLADRKYFCIKLP